MNTDSICYTISINWVDASGMSFAHSTGVWSTPENVADDVEARVEAYMASRVEKGWEPKGTPAVEYRESKGHTISGTAR